MSSKPLTLTSPAKQPKPAKQSKSAKPEPMQPEPMQPVAEPAPISEPVAAEPVAQPAKQSKSNGNGVAKPLSLTGEYRKLVVQHPDWTLDQIRADLNSRKLEVRESTLTTIRSDTLSTINVLRQLGMFTAAS